MILDVMNNNSVLDADMEMKYEILALSGIFVDKQAQRIGFNHTRIVRELLKGTKFSNITAQNFNEYLQRLGGASERFVCNNIRARAVSIDYTLIKQLLGLDS